MIKMVLSHCRWQIQLQRYISYHSMLWHFHRFWLISGPVSLKLSSISVGIIFSWNIPLSTVPSDFFTSGHCMFAMAPIGIERTAAVAWLANESVQLTISHVNGTMRTPSRNLGSFLNAYSASPPPNICITAMARRMSAKTIYTIFETSTQTCMKYFRRPKSHPWSNLASGAILRGWSLESSKWHKRKYQIKYLDKCINDVTIFLCSKTRPADENYRRKNILKSSVLSDFFRKCARDVSIIIVEEWRRAWDLWVHLHLILLGDSRWFTERVLWYWHVWWRASFLRVW